jgi:hypothetical protein
VFYVSQISVSACVPSIIKETWKYSTTNLSSVSEWTRKIFDKLGQGSFLDRASWNHLRENALKCESEIIPSVVDSREFIAKNKRFLIFFAIFSVSLRHDSFCTRLTKDRFNSLLKLFRFFFHQLIKEAKSYRWRLDESFVWCDSPNRLA